MTEPTAPYHELVNTLEFGAEAAKVLSPEVFRTIAGSDRTPFDRVTFRPRMMVNCMGLDLSTDVAGIPLFAPIIVGPVSDQRRFHADAERATVKGASAGKAAVVIPPSSSVPLEDLAREASTPIFGQVYASEGGARAAARARAAVGAGCTAVLITVGVTEAGRPVRRIDWAAVDAISRAAAVPAIVKGVASVADARAALRTGARGIVVSNYGQPAAPGRQASLDLLPAVTDAVEGRVPVLVDGGFRRGTDIMKALALGARAVLVSRPVMWGLAAYGADGVQAVVEMLQTELGRVMGCCGTPTLAAITRAHVKVHAPAG